MRRIFFVAVLAVAPVFGADCDRACLRGMLDQYLTALSQHNPSAAKLSVGFRQTENSVVRPLGTGLWQTAKGPGKLQRRYFDTVSGQAGYFGLFDETAGPAIVSLRLKVESGKVTEAEWYLSRKGDPGIGTGAGLQANASFFDPEYLAAHAPPADAGGRKGASPNRIRG